VTVSAVGDVNGDQIGVADLVTRLDCLYPSTYLTQLVVYTQDQGGAYLTVGTVISVNGPIGRVAINPDGSIRVVLRENATGEPVLKWFTYRWDGSTFARSGPAVDVPADPPSQLSVTAHVATTGRVATMTLTVHNGGSAASDDLHVSLAAPRDLVTRFGTAGADPLRGGGFAGDYGWGVTIEAVPPGTSVVGTFVIELPEPGQSTDLTVSVTGATVRTDPQPNIDDANRVTVTLKAA
jgi:hypothetical protein